MAEQLISLIKLNLFYKMLGLQICFDQIIISGYRFCGYPVLFVNHS